MGFSVIKLSGTAPIPVTPSTPVGSSWGASLEQELEPRGDGNYRVTVTANGTCNNIAYNLTPNNPAPSDVLPVLRPVITGPGGTSRPYGIWWLGGGGDATNGYYNNATLAVNGNGAPGPLAWSVPQGASKVSLSCTSCSFPLVTSSQPSANCVYDIEIKVNFSGFYSNAYQLNVNSPYYVESGGLSTTEDYLDGWFTVIPYRNRDRCQYQMPSIALNEVFGTFTPSPWAKPAALGLSSYGSYTWYDQIFISGCAACTPPSVQRNPANQTLADQAQQYWRIGSEHSRHRSLRPAKHVSTVHGTWRPRQCFADSVRDQSCVLQHTQQ